MPDLTIYTGLFLVSFGAASLLPMQSETFLIALLAAEIHPAWLLVTIASSGNVLGAVLNWVFGRWIERFRDRRWFPANEASLHRAQRWYRRYGKWSLLLSWVPIVGDPLTIVAGVLREPLASFFVLVTIAKVGRYLGLVWLAQPLIGAT